MNRNAAGPRDIAGIEAHRHRSWRRLKACCCVPACLWESVPALPRRGGPDSSPHAAAVARLLCDPLVLGRVAHDADVVLSGVLLLHGGANPGSIEGGP